MNSVKHAERSFDTVLEFLKKPSDPNDLASVQENLIFLITRISSSLFEVALRAGLMEDKELIQRVLVTNHFARMLHIALETDTSPADTHLARTRKRFMEVMANGKSEFTNFQAPSSRRPS